MKAVKKLLIFVIIFGGIGLFFYDRSPHWALNTLARNIDAVLTDDVNNAIDWSVFPDNVTEDMTITLTGVQNPTEEQKKQQRALAHRLSQRFLTPEGIAILVEKKSREGRHYASEDFVLRTIRVAPSYVVAEIGFPNSRTDAPVATIGLELQGIKWKVVTMHLPLGAIDFALNNMMY